LVLNKGDKSPLGILLEYDDQNENKFLHKIEVNPRKPIEKINVGFIGAGSFAQGYLIPKIKAWGASLDTVVNKSGASATNVARRFGFGSSSTNPTDVLGNDDINTVFIATQHDTHADLCIEALKVGKNVFVEKPLSIDEAGLDKIQKLFTDFDNPFLMVGYNRRYSNAAKIAKEEFENLNEPLMINIRVNAGFIENDHWINDPQKGGGRIVGELCHFIDLMQYLADSEPDSVYSSGITNQNLKFANQDNVSIIINFKNGSIGNLIYCSTGDKSLPKERIEIHGGQKAVVIDNFNSVTVHKNNRPIKHKNVDKGHKKEIFAFLDLINNGKPMPQDFKSLIQTSKTTFRILDSLSTGLPQKV
jgi:polar amino acid transport system substrate-binding protein